MTRFVIAFLAGGLSACVRPVPVSSPVVPGGGDPPTPGPDPESVTPTVRDPEAPWAAFDGCGFVALDAQNRVEVGVAAGAVSRWHNVQEIASGGGLLGDLIELPADAEPRSAVVVEGPQGALLAQDWAGFGQVSYRNLTMGVAALHSGWKI